MGDDLHSGGFVRWVPLERVRGGESFADSLGPTFELKQADLALIGQT